MWQLASAFRCVASASSFSAPNFPSLGLSVLISLSFRTGGARCLFYAPAATTAIARPCTRAAPSFWHRPSRRGAKRLARAASPSRWRRSRRVRGRERRGGRGEGSCLFRNIPIDRLCAPVFRLTLQQILFVLTCRACPPISRTGRALRAGVGRQRIPSNHGRSGARLGRRSARPPRRPDPSHPRVNTPQGRLDFFGLLIYFFNSSSCLLLP